MRTSKPPHSPEQVQDSIRLRELFKQRATMTQLEFGHAYRIGNQGMVWQYLHADKPKGAALNVAAAVKFAQGLGCCVADFSPSLQEEIDRIAQFASGKPPTGGNVRGRKAAFVKANASNWQVYNEARPTTQAAIDLLLLPQHARARLEPEAQAAIVLMESIASKALEAQKLAKKAA